MPDLDHLRIDGTTYDLKDSTAREKDAVQDNELDSLKSALNFTNDIIGYQRQNQNLMNIAADVSFTEGHFVRKYDGVLGEASDFRASDYLDISGISKIVYSRVVTTVSDSSVGVAFYDSTKQFISSEASVSGASAAGYVLTALDVPNTAQYFRFTERTSTPHACLVYSYTDYQKTLTARTTGLENDVSGLENDILALENEVRGHVLIESGNYVYPGGKEKTDDATRMRTALPINIENIATISIPTGYGAWVYYFDGEMSKLADSGTVVQGIIFDRKYMPANTEYITASIRNMSTPSADISGEIGAVQNGIKIVDLIDAELNMIDAGLKTLANDLEYAYVVPTAALTVEGEVKASTGEIVAGGGNYLSTDYIDISAWGSFPIVVVMPTFVVTNDIGMAFYDSSKNYISGVAGNVKGEAGTEARDIEIPDGAVYARFSSRKTQVDDFYVRNNFARNLQSVYNECGIIQVKSGIIQVKNSDIVQGSYMRDGSIRSSNTTRITLQKFIDINVGDTIYFKPGTLTEDMLCGFIYTNRNLFETAWNEGETAIVSQYAGKLALMFRKHDNADITPSEYDAEVKIIRNYNFYSGSKRYNGLLFRSNYAEAIPLPESSSSPYPMTYNQFIAKYDAFINQLNASYDDVASSVPKPVTITKTSLQTLNSGNVVYKYVFAPAYPKKTVYFVAGIHGNEYEGVWALYNFMRLMYTQTYDYPQLEEIKQDVKFVIIPSANPDGFENNTKNNADNKNIYLYYFDDSQNQPKEMLAIKQVLQDETIDYFMDWHTDPYTPAKACYGYADPDSPTFLVLYNMIVKFRDIMYVEYNYVSKYLDNSKDIIVGIPGGTGSVDYMKAQGITANLIEIATGAESQISAFAPTGSADMMRMANDWYINVFLEMYNKVIKNA